MDRTVGRPSDVVAAPGGPEPGELADLAESVARETAALALEVRERAVHAEEFDTKSSATDVVTEGDHACEALVRERLAAARPGDLVLGEEGGTSGTPAPGQVRWVVDPIDGTVNYLHGLPWFSVSVGAEVDGRVVAGAVVEPVSGRVWRAARGQGAQRDGVPLRVSALEDLALAVVGTGLNYDPARRGRQAAVLARVAARLGDVRRTGCWTSARSPRDGSTASGSTACSRGTSRRAGSSPRRPAPWCACPAPTPTAWAPRRPSSRRLPWPRR
jgi:myo-inositol-1(or 4)-monophosphatase